MTKGVRRWIVVLALVGLAAAASSSYMHFQLMSNPGYTSFCDINETVSCTQLYQSRFGSVAGVPVALGGVFWFGVVLLLSVADVRGSTASREHVAAYFVVWSTVGLSVAMYMAYASVYVLQTFCLLCGIVYVTVVGIFLLSGSRGAIPLRTLPASITYDLGQLVRRPVGLVTTATFLGTMALAAVWFPEPQPLGGLTESLANGAPPVSPENEQSEFARFWAAQPRIELPIASETGAAPVMVYKFNDYQCPACAQAHFAYDPIFAKYESSDPGSVRLVTVDFPLDPECNDETPNGPHGSACEAAVAVRLAREVGAEEGRRLERWLYSNQETMTATSIVQALGEIAGVDDGLLATRYDEVIEHVRSDIAVGATLPVQGTPTYVINGVLLSAGMSPLFFDQAIVLELQRATTP